MFRQIMQTLAIVTVIAITVPGEARADWDEFWARFDLDRKRNEAWPHPFLVKDQARQREPFSAMVMHGWQINNTLVESHFDPESHELNKAGIVKVQSILRTSPPSQRSIFVYGGFDPNANRQRMENVQMQLSKWVPQDLAPAVVMTPNRPYAAPGTQIDAINRRYVESMPSPNIPVSLGGSAGAGGGGGN